VRIAIVTPALGGHARPAIRLAAVLGRQGHSVHFWTNKHYGDPARAAGAEFHPFEPVPSPAPFPPDAGYSATLAIATDESSERLISALLQADIDLVVHDVAAPWARVAGDFLGLPRVASDPMFPIPWAPAGLDLPVPRSAAASAAMVEMERRRRAIARKWGVDIGEAAAVMRQPAPFTVSYTTAEVTGRADPAPGWRYVGPLMDPAPKPPTATDRPLVYVAFGTYSSYRSEPFTLALEALAGEPVDVLVATGPGIARRRMSLGAVPSNARVLGTVASRDILAQARVHITHGGSGSVHESLLAGVPMVCLPQGSDQRWWCERLETLGVGRIAAPDPLVVRTTVQEVLDDAAMRARTRALGGRLAAVDGDAAVATLIGEVR
jgi:MGT family glycosyltransferase